MRVTSRAVYLLVALLCGTLGAQAQTADEVVQQNLKATGAANWKNVQTMKVAATITVQGQKAAMTVWEKRPKLLRQELLIQNVTLVQAFDGETVWAINPQMFGGSEAPHEVPGPAAASIKDQAEFESALLDYKAKGNSVELVGKETVSGHDAYHLKVVRKSGPVQHFYIDTQSGLSVRVTTDIDQGGQPVTLTSDPSNYKAVEGIMMPFNITQTVGGMATVVLSIDKIEFNLPMDAAMFKMPKM
jgi:outer membrane lipoprotein-sorting protein